MSTEWLCPAGHWRSERPDGELTYHFPYAIMEVKLQVWVGHDCVPYLFCFERISAFQICTANFMGMNPPQGVEWLVFFRSFWFFDEVLAF